MCSLTVLPISRPWYWVWRSPAHPSSSMLQSFGSGSLKFTVRLCKMQQATIMVLPCQEPSSPLSVAHEISSTIQKFAPWYIMWSCVFCWNAPPEVFWGWDMESQRMESKHSHHPHVAHHIWDQSLQGYPLQLTSGKCGYHELNQAI